MMIRPEVAAWQAAYRELDNSALLSLLPVLDAALEAAKVDLDLKQAGLKLDEETREQVTRHLQDAMAWREKGIDISEFVVQVEEMADASAKNAPKFAEAYRQSFAYVSDLMMRKGWILNEEVQRRGLLPNLTDFPYPEPS